MEYCVWGVTEIDVSVVIEADNKEEALKEAEKYFGGIHSFVGNGGTNKLIGVTGDNEGIESEGEIEWKFAEEA